MERIDWQTQQSTTGERGTDTHKKHDNKLLWLYHRHQYQHHYYIQQISIPGAWGILEIFVILRYLRLYLLIISFILHGCILFTRLPKMHLKHHKEAGQHVVWYVGAWFGWKDNTYWPPKSGESGNCKLYNDLLMEQWSQRSAWFDPLCLSVVFVHQLLPSILTWTCCSICNNVSWKVGTKTIGKDRQQILSILSTRNFSLCLLLPSTALSCSTSN